MEVLGLWTSNKGPVPPLMPNSCNVFLSTRPHFLQIPEHTTPIIPYTELAALVIAKRKELWNECQSVPKKCQSQL